MQIRVIQVVSRPHPLPHVRKGLVKEKHIRQTKHFSAALDSNWSINTGHRHSMNSRTTSRTCSKLVQRRHLCVESGSGIAHTTHFAIMKLQVLFQVTLLCGYLSDSRIYTVHILNSKLNSLVHLHQTLPRVCEECGLGTSYTGRFHMHFYQPVSTNLRLILSRQQTHS